MSLLAARLHDICTGHGCFPPRPCIEASTDVFTNNRGAMRVGDVFATHCCPKKGCHKGNLARGSSTVFINNRAAGRITDPVSCGSRVMTASDNVLIG